MLRYLIIRLLNTIPLLIGITLITFFVIRLAPGNPTFYEGAFNPKVKPEAIKKLEKLYGLDKPLYQQYLTWLKRLSHLDFGNSFVDGKPVIEKIKERLPVTLLINILSLTIILLVAIPIGIVSAIKRNSFLDKALTVFVFIGFSMPGYWLALLLMILFGIKLKILPISGLESLNAAQLKGLALWWDRAKHLILPVFISAFGGLAGFSRYMRQSMLEVLQQDYIVTARAKGLPEKLVIKRHALRNSLMPIVTLLGLSVPGLIGGSVIFETIFAIPGMGQLFYEAAMARDYPTIMGILTIGAVLTLLGNLMADISYALIDPRIRYGD
ncbi:peptide/nickel transport system permease [Thermosulfidibacter takaii ABI70S6]|uniref:Peptide/nickel transport system permease n=1 Tax=Thermosulfidibacter takaii (strain DSM 17441 / JCM 13301 / NBRC 103674 / ABI70S6) TaxID=1298851 RepID=A0A0S3QSN9_THET7|nr:ABC transporter permease [Thermosulfidibacter takaii]BAT71342.1 peptide/nickel transport system permease [Thermosulfidibacter takaii ABI70S6]